MKKLIIRLVKDTLKDPVKREKVLNYIRPIISDYKSKKR